MENKIFDKKVKSLSVHKKHFTTKLCIKHKTKLFIVKLNNIEMMMKNYFCYNYKVHLDLLSLVNFTIHK